MLFRSYLIGDEINSLSESIESLKSELEKVSTNQGLSSNEIKTFESRIAELETDRAELTNKISLLEARLNELPSSPSDPVTPLPSPTLPIQATPSNDDQ